MTNDGELTHRLTHPSFEVAKIYVAEVSGLIGKAVLRRLLETGVDLGDAEPFRVDEAKCSACAGARAPVPLSSLRCTRVPNTSSAGPSKRWLPGYPPRTDRDGPPAPQPAQQRDLPEAHEGRGSLPLSRGRSVGWDAGLRVKGLRGATTSSRGHGRRGQGGHRRADHRDDEPQRPGQGRPHHDHLHRHTRHPLGVSGGRRTLHRDLRRTPALRNRARTSPEPYPWSSES